MPDMNAKAIGFKVRYYSHRSTPNKSAHPSRKGVWYRYFEGDKEAAEKFAAEHVVYGKDCIVEEYEYEVKS